MLLLSGVHFVPAQTSKGPLLALEPSPLIGHYICQHYVHYTHKQLMSDKMFTLCKAHISSSKIGQVRALKSSSGNA